MTAEIIDTVEDDSWPLDEIITLAEPVPDRPLIHFVALAEVCLRQALVWASSGQSVELRRCRQRLMEAQAALSQLRRQLQ
jgi:hypothetical protein